MEGHTIIVNKIHDLGEIYLKSEERGNIYIDGELLCILPCLSYGYNISSAILNKADALDKDKVLKATSKLWRYSDCIDTAVTLIRDCAEDIKYITNVNYNVKTYKDYDREKDIDLLLKGKL